MTLEAILLTALFGLLFAGILSGIPAWLAIGGAPLLVALAGVFLDVFDPAFLSAWPQRVLGMMTNPYFVAIPLFILMGVVLEKSGLAKDMLRVVEALGGNSRKRMALSVLAISTLIAASTGIAGATIVMLGMISYPALVRAGVPETCSSGLVVASGTLGQIIPPSIVLIVLADQVSNAWQLSQRQQGSFSVEPITVNELFAGALLPGLLLAGVYAVYLVVRLSGERMETTQVEPMPGVENAKGEMALLLLPLLLIVAVLGSILSGIATATEASAVGASGSVLLAGYRHARRSKNALASLASVLGLLSLAGLFALGMIGAGSRGIGFHTGSVLIFGVFAGLLACVLLLGKKGLLRDCLGETASFSGVIFAIVMAASLLSLVVRGFGGDEAFAAFANSLPGDKWTALVLVMAVVFVLGFVLEFIEIAFIVVPIAGPVLFSMGIDPIWFAILLAINLQTSFLTPLMGVALFYFRSVAPAGLSSVAIYKGIIPFVLMQLLALFLLFVFPQFALFLPETLFN